MKKIQKIMAYSLLGIIVATFFIVFIVDMVNIDALTYAFKNFSNLWSTVITWFLDIALAIFITYLAAKELYEVYTNKSNEEKVLKKVNFILFLFLLVSSFAGLLVIINVVQVYQSSAFRPNLAKPIVLIVFQVLGAVAFLLANNKFSKNIINKLVVGIGYLILFISLILSASSGVSGFQVAVLVFMFLINIIGAIYALTYDIDLEKVFSKVSKPVEEKNETPESDDVERKLLKLKSLFEQNLITEEEYEEKRKEIINKF